MKPLRFKDILQNPVLLLAYGFGVGLAPKMPGTWGSLLALPLYWLLQNLSLLPYLVVLLLLTIAGSWLCGQAAADVGVDDPGGIVLDEMIGLLFVFIGLSFSWYTVLVGFLLFRLFDIFKPWPIGWLDKKIKGGVGIMLDDVLAGVCSCLLLHSGVYLGLFTL